MSRRRPIFGLAPIPSAVAPFPGPPPAAAPRRRSPQPRRHSLVPRHHCWPRLRSVPRLSLRYLCVSSLRASAHRIQRLPTSRHSMEGHLDQAVVVSCNYASLSRVVCQGHVVSARRHTGIHSAFAHSYCTRVAYCHTVSCERDIADRRSQPTMALYAMAAEQPRPPSLVAGIYLAQVCYFHWVSAPIETVGYCAMTVGMQRMLKVGYLQRAHPRGRSETRLRTSIRGYREGKVGEKVGRVVDGKRKWGRLLPRNTRWAKAVCNGTASNANVKQPLG